MNTQSLRSDDSRINGRHMSKMVETLDKIMRIASETLLTTNVHIPACAYVLVKCSNRAPRIECPRHRKCVGPYCTVPESLRSSEYLAIMGMASKAFVCEQW